MGVAWLARRRRDCRPPRKEREKKYPQEEALGMRQEVEWRCLCSSPTPMVETKTREADPESGVVLLEATADWKLKLKAMAERGSPRRCWMSCRQPEMEKEDGGGAFPRAPLEKMKSSAKVGGATRKKKMEEGGGWFPRCTNPRSLTWGRVGLRMIQPGQAMRAEWPVGITLMSKKKRSGGPDLVEKLGSLGLWQGPNAEEAVGFTISCEPHFFLEHWATIN
ncbi:unnamed protein product [Linum trigynum]|uniref:Uncharacterized protein n=1 Tax=Linum trigynum TaxID=586398 RepID=A0AAV2DX69_9ROSI